MDVDSPMSQLASPRKLRRVSPGILVVGGLLLVLLSVPTLAGDYWAYELGLFLLYGIAAQSVGFCWGKAGLLPLGQSFFFGISAYLAGTILKDTEGPVAALMLPLAVVLPSIAAFVIGKLLFSRRNSDSSFFSLITLAIAILANVLAVKWTNVTGGFTGMGGIPTLFGLDRYKSMYWIASGAALLSTAVMYYLGSRPLAVVLRALSSDEHRLRLLGYDSNDIKTVAFTVSAALASFAGLLYAPYQGLVTPQMIGFLFAAELVVWAAVGGRASAIGPLIGAVLIGVGTGQLRDRFEYWQILIAFVFLIVVRWFPDGLASVVTVSKKGRRRLQATSESEAPAIEAPSVPHRGSSFPTFELIDVSARPHGVRVLEDLSLRILSPGVYCIIGPNGAGKSSTFNAITGSLALSAGSVSLGGESLQSSMAWEIARRGIYRKLQIPTVFGGLTVAENLQLALWARRNGTRILLSAELFQWVSDLLQTLLRQFPVLKRELETDAAYLSQGDRQALEFVMVALLEPVVFLLDEPCAGLSITETQQMMEAIVDVTATLKCATLVIEHDMSAVEHLSDDVLVLHEGSLLARGTLDEIRNNAQVAAVYAGGRK